MTFESDPNAPNEATSNQHSPPADTPPSKKTPPTAIAVGGVRTNRWTGTGYRPRSCSAYASESTQCAASSVES
jgi:hypothetical protein